MSEAINNKKMLKKAEKEQKKAEKAASSKKGKAGLITSLVIVLLVGGATALTVFNVFGLRDNVLFPLLRDIPFVSSLIPDVPVEDVAIPIDVDELIAEIANFENIIEILSLELAALEQERDGFILEISRLREIEDMQIAHLAERQEFERMLAENDPSAFQAFFENINPELAAQLYADVVGLNNITNQMTELASTWSGMRSANIAQAIETMINTDMELIVSVLNIMTVNDRASILNNLSAETVAAISRQMQP